MPLALIVFGDKTHTDLHGALSVTPIMFTLSLFNRDARMSRNFWRPLAYIPNIQHGKSKKDKTKSGVKVQDEHRCLSAAFRPLKDLTRTGNGIALVVNQVQVKGIVWIHFFIGDTSGLNVWLGHYNGSQKMICCY